MLSFEERLDRDLVACLRYYADPTMTGHDPPRPVDKIVFASQGEIAGADYSFMGYGVGPEGVAFSDCGVFDLCDIFILDSSSDPDATFESQFDVACAAVVASLTRIAGREEFRSVPKAGPVLFELNVVDQASRVICRIHPDGRVELPRRVDVEIGSR